MAEMFRKKMCVVGAGVSGLPAVKTCLEDDVDVECFDKLDKIGGLWRYRETDKYGVPSVSKNTIIDSSKELYAYSDFPPNERYANFMHNSCVIEYLEDYAKHFKLLPHIHLEHEVLEIKQNDDYDETGKWKVRIKNKEGEIKEKVFDGVFACTGHHTYPHVPQFPGLDKFKGRVMHTHAYKSHEGFEDKRIAVIGVGNSGMDTTVELARVGKQVYMSTRRGTWIFSRVVWNGYPWDVILLRRIFNYIFSYVPAFVPNYFYEFMCSQRMDHELYGLKPSHRFMQQHPTVGDDLPNAVLAGRVIVKRDIDHFTENGIVFQGDDEETELDCVILATGYNMKMHFLDKNVLEVKDNVADLYARIFPPLLKHPTLAIIGFVQPHGSLAPVSEMQCRWAIRIFRQKSKLPSQDKMLEEIENRRDYMKKNFVQSQRHTVECNYIEYITFLASQIGANPDYLSLVFRDPVLFYKCIFGPCVAYTFRLNGPYPWPGASKAIMSVIDRVEAPLKLKELEGTPKKPQEMSIFGWVAIAFLVLIIVAFVF